jgi:hypothetical protein
MAVKNGAPTPRSASKAASSTTRGEARQQTGRTLSPGEVAILQTMIAEAEAMRLRLNRTK